MLFDYHTHTILCGHAEGTPVDTARAAIAAGLEGVGLSEHNPMPSEFDDWRMRLEDLPRYLDMVAQARDAVAPFPVRLGLECDFLAGQEAWIEDLAGRAQWDYLIGSVHYIAPGWDVDNPKWRLRWTEMPAEEIWEIYYDLLVQSIRCGLFDIIAHSDLPKKFGHRPPESVATMHDAVADAAAEARVAFEINTAGWHKDCREQYPSLGLLKKLAKAKVPIVISSDAHSPHHVARDFDRALGIAREAGFENLAVFEGRQRTLHPLLHSHG